MSASAALASLNRLALPVRMPGTCRRDGPGWRSAREQRRAGEQRRDDEEMFLHGIVAPLLDRPQIRGDVVHLLVLGIVELEHHLLVRRRFGSLTSTFGTPLLRAIDLRVPSGSVRMTRKSSLRTSVPSSFEPSASVTVDGIAGAAAAAASAAAAERPRSSPRPSAFCSARGSENFDADALEVAGHRMARRRRPRRSTASPAFGVADEHVQLDVRSGCVRAGCPGRSSSRERCGCIRRWRRCRPRPA